MKIIYRIPTRQYAYIEVTEDTDDKPTEREITNRYFRLEDEYNKQKKEREENASKEIPFPSKDKDVKCGIGKTRNEYLKEIKDKKDAKV